MTKEELIKNQFPNDEFLQSGVLQIVDKCVADLEKENDRLSRKCECLTKNNESLADVASDVEKLEEENTLVKSLLYCTERTCDNCGFVNCENFQRQRKSEPCSLYISYQVRIKNLVHESDVLRESYNNSEMNLASVSEQLAKAKEIIKKFSEFVNNEVEYDPEHPQEHTDLWNELCGQAEQFLNSEVEK